MDRVLLGMSGGVDSSTSALILKNKGYEVVGVTMLLYDNENSKKAIEDAKKVCEMLGIEHRVADFSSEFSCSVINNFIDEYKSAKTPNPCVECNRKIKFGKMVELSDELDCKYIATGHYAKIFKDEKTNRYSIAKSKNVLKDQSYFLYTLKQDVLSRIIFPLDNFKTKDDVREFAKQNGLAVYSKKDSEDICFIPDGNYIDFLYKNSNIKEKKGNIVDKDGNILGTHLGLFNYTVGQRKGLGISYFEPLYVIGFNVLKNEVIVGTKKELLKKHVELKDVNFQLMTPEKLVGKKVNVKIRYSNKEYSAKLMFDDKYYLEFDEMVGPISPGQSAVFYVGDNVAGGGIIVK